MDQTLYLAGKLCSPSSDTVINRLKAGGGWRIPQGSRLGASSNFKCPLFLFSFSEIKSNLPQTNGCLGLYRSKAALREAKGQAY